MTRSLKTPFGSHVSNKSGGTKNGSAVGVCGRLICCSFLNLSVGICMKFLHMLSCVRLDGGVYPTKLLLGINQYCFYL